MTPSAPKSSGGGLHPAMYALQTVLLSSVTKIVQLSGGRRASAEAGSASRHQPREDVVWQLCSSKKTADMLPMLPPQRGLLATVPALTRITPVFLSTATLQSPAAFASSAQIERIRAAEAAMSTTREKKTVLFVRVMKCPPLRPDVATLCACRRATPSSGSRATA